MKLFLLFWLCNGISLAAQGVLSPVDSVGSVISLDTVTVTAVSRDRHLSEPALAVVSADREALEAHRGNSLMHSLSHLPGISAMLIGQGFSKPVIRGLGFNRVAVVESGIKQQGQQWGADHGLEIDQYNVDRITIIKGPASLQYGSDAMAGAVVIRPYRLTKADGFSGDLLLTGSSNNQLYGGSAAAHYQRQGYYVKGRATYRNFGDYRTPADSFRYLNYTFPLSNGMLKNTAGRETDVSVQTGFIGNQTSSVLSISNVNARTGFFAGSHGLPTIASLVDDNDNRNIDLPYQYVNHFKTVFNQSVQWGNGRSVAVDAGYQYNLRQEYSPPHTHGYAPMPEGDKELELRLHTATLNMAGDWLFDGGNRLQAGINTEYQYHRTGGYSFLLPYFEQMSYGVFVIDHYHFSDRWSAAAGVRYDRTYLHVHRHIDDYLPEMYRQRSPEMKKQDGDFSFTLGSAFIPHPLWEIKVNIGKSFRMPTVSEYSSNGVHHGMFRHELGDSTLSSESSYQLDFSVTGKGDMEGFIRHIAGSVSLFGNYFPNFVFLSPTGEFSWLPDAGQYYRYRQSTAFRAGGEIQLNITFARGVHWDSMAEYVHATDLSDGYPIPFTPPLMWTNEWSVTGERLFFLTAVRAALAYRYAASQNRVTHNEPATPGYHLFDLSLSAGIPVGKNGGAWRIQLQIQNLFHTVYYNHISFYRYLNLPESGRNFLLSVNIPIYTRAESFRPHLSYSRTN